MRRRLFLGLLVLALAGCVEGHKPTPAQRTSTPAKASDAGQKAQQ